MNCSKCLLNRLLMVSDTEWVKRAEINSISICQDADTFQITFQYKLMTKFHSKSILCFEHFQPKCSKIKKTPFIKKCKSFSCWYYEYSVYTKVCIKFILKQFIPKISTQKTIKCVTKIVKWS